MCTHEETPQIKIPILIQIIIILMKMNKSIILIIHNKILVTRILFVTQRFIPKTVFFCFCFHNFIHSQHNFLGTVRGKKNYQNCLKRYLIDFLSHSIDFFLEDTTDNIVRFFFCHIFGVFKRL